ncbi:transglycosylase SLT domain-containing protein [Candidatus Woesearchaeota archaeon]|nr:transglycosylase SLT domain-containing protein [Candidatus Woesearchaeota archaeon]
MHTRRKFLRDGIGLVALLTMAPYEILAAEPKHGYAIQYQASKDYGSAKKTYESLTKLFPDQSFILAHMDGLYKVLNNTPADGRFRSCADTQREKKLEDILLSAHGIRLESEVKPLNIDHDSDFLPVDISDCKEPNGYYVMIASNSNDSYVEDNVRRLAEAGFMNIRLMPTRQNSTEFTRTLVGEYAEDEGAESAALRLFRIKRGEEYWLDDVNIVGIRGKRFSWIRPMQNPDTERISKTKAGQKRIGGISMEEFFTREVDRYNMENGTDYDPFFVMALAYTESKFKLDATGYKLVKGSDGRLKYHLANGERVPTARGLMQVSIDNLKKYHVRDWRDPGQNLRAGLSHIQYAEEMFNDMFRGLGQGFYQGWRKNRENRMLVLGAAYNGGEYRVKNILMEARTHKLDLILSDLPAETRRHIMTLTEQYKMLKDNKEGTIASNEVYQRTFRIPDPVM